MRRISCRSVCLSVLAILVISALPVIGAAETRLPGLNLSLTDKQVTALQGVFEEYTAENLVLLVEIEKKFTDLKFELRKKDRFESKFKEINSVYKANTLVKEISKLHGEVLKTRVTYLLKAKDVFTQEQRARLFARVLDYEFEMPDEIFTIVEENLISLDIGLTLDQIKKILLYRADMDKKAIDINYKKDLQLIELQLELFKDRRDSEKMNRLLLTITDLGTQLMDNRVVHFLKAKDVLTVAQKKKLLHSVSMLSGY